MQISNFQCDKHNIKYPVGIFEDQEGKGNFISNHTAAQLTQCNDIIDMRLITVINRCAPNLKYLRDIVLENASRRD